MFDNKKYLIKRNDYKWHAVYLKYRCETKVHERLSNNGIECYLPCRLSKRIWSDRVKTIKEPLFPSYIFVKVSNSEYYDVLFVDGVLRYVSFENKPVVIQNSQINSLKLLVDNLNDEIMISTERIRKGCLVRIINGPLKNAEGEVVETRGKKQLLLRLFHIGFNVYVDLGDNEIEILKYNSTIAV